MIPRGDGVGVGGTSNASFFFFLCQIWASTVDKCNLSTPADRSARSLFDFLHVLLVLELSPFLPLDGVGEDDLLESFSFII